jgi:hypothetical protein
MNKVLPGPRVVRLAKNLLHLRPHIPAQHTSKYNMIHILHDLTQNIVNIPLSLSFLQLLNGSQYVIEKPTTKKILTFKGIFVSHTFIILLLSTPPELMNLYKDLVEVNHPLTLLIALLAISLESHHILNNPM